ncbi:MAG: dihydrolipoyllysine-residue acetyltransferase [Woeseiaceae bacterium]
MANEHEITVPDIGDVDSVEVIEILVAPGDTIDIDDGILTMETDKASMDVPSTHAGIVKSITVSLNDKIKEGDVIAIVSVEAGESPQAETTAVESEAAVEAESVAPVTPAAASAGPVTISVPDIGDIDVVDVIEIAVQVGDRVGVDDPLLTLETDKASMDIPSTHAGIVREIHVAVGDQVKQGAAIVLLDAEADSSAAAEPAEVKAAPTTTKPAEAPRPAEKPSAPSPARGESKKLPAIDEAGFSKAHASPSVRKLARELGVNLVQVKGSGTKGRIVADDLKAWVKKMLSSGGAGAATGGGLPALPKVDFSRFGDISESPLTRIQKISGPRLQASWVNLPHVTQHDLADTTEMEARRQTLKGKAAERGVKLTPLAFVMRGVVQALAEYPKLNSSLSQDGTTLINKHYCHLGFAADTDDGLVVPVIHDADKMDVYELATALADLSAAARDGKLTPKQMQGATFTISSLGGIGGTAFTPIVNAPEVGILGVSRASMQPVWDGENFQPRLMLPLSLSYDHRVVDGALAVRFTTYLSQCLGNVDGLLQAIP